MGELCISSVSPIILSEISESDARRAGHESLDALLAALRSRPDGTFYRVELGALRPDPRVQLRETVALTDDERRHVHQQLERYDARAPGGPWTRRTLDVIVSHPGVRAGDLCRLVGENKEEFKLNVRKLKKLGLTESLETGYRLSPRGLAFVWTVRS